MVKAGNMRFLGKVMPDIKKTARHTEKIVIILKSGRGDEKLIQPMPHKLKRFNHFIEGIGIMKWKIKAHIQPKHFRHKRFMYFQKTQHDVFLRIGRLFFHFIEK